ncbi:conserved hypothetical protein [Tenacibaculum litopenaei]|uniref:DUF1842 domain-containing protein n=1 Tax=Tenacibaculum litopenaei TaxID=396016 RepID=UPI0038934A39
MSTTTETPVEIKSLRGILGSEVNFNAPYVKFNLTTGATPHEVHGTVHIYMDPPGNKPYVGMVSGKVYATGYKPYVQIVTLEGLIPSRDIYTPLNFPFTAYMDLEADGKGVGGFTFQGRKLEQLPVTYQES